MTVKFELRYLFSDVDRHGNRRLFVRRNGRKIRIRAAFGTVAFAQAYNDALEALASPAGRILPSRRIRPGQGHAGLARGQILRFRRVQGARSRLAAHTPARH